MFALCKNYVRSISLRLQSMNKSHSTFVHALFTQYKVYFDCKPTLFVAKKKLFVTRMTFSGLEIILIIINICLTPEQLDEFLYGL